MHVKYGRRHDTNAYQLGMSQSNYINRASVAGAVHDDALSQHIGSSQFRAKFCLYDLMTRRRSSDGNHAASRVSGSSSHGFAARLDDAQSVLKGERASGTRCSEFTCPWMRCCQKMVRGVRKETERCAMPRQSIAAGWRKKRSDAPCRGSQLRRDGGRAAVLVKRGWGMYRERGLLLLQWRRAVCCWRQ
jgi:hypothetical protein